MVACFTCINWPLMVWERMRFGAAIRRQKVQSPVFIIGHQRSGTTYLHYLMARDPQFGYLSVKESFMPWIYLSQKGWLVKMLSAALPDKRPMDNLRLGIDLPTEPEYSLGNMTPATMIVGYNFPNIIKSTFKAHVLFEDERAKKQWKSALVYFMKKLTLHHQGKPILLKSPENLARVRTILEIYPDARFVHIARNPYTVYFSTERLYEVTLPLTALQHCKAEVIEEFILQSYPEYYKRFFDDLKHIPPGQLAEVRYEDLIGNEVQTLRKVYAQLGLKGFEQAEAGIANEAASYRDYKTNSYTYPEAKKAEIAQHWGWVFEQLGYPV